MIDGFQHVVLLALVSGAVTVTDVVKLTNAYVEDVEIVFNQLEANKQIKSIHRPLGVYNLICLKL